MFVEQSHNGEIIFFSENRVENAIEQTIKLANSPLGKNANIRIMPDYHVGAGGPIGLTMKVNDLICPNFVSVDIGCGVLTAIIRDHEIDVEELDKIIHEKIPAGFSIRSNPLLTDQDFAIFEMIYCYDAINWERARKSIGTLGGGNHYIELGLGNDGETLYLTVHTGSRNFGKQIADYYQNLANEECNKPEDHSATIAKMRADGRANQIQGFIRDMAKRRRKAVDKDTAYLSGELKEAYLHDMRIAQKYAEENRRWIMNILLTSLGVTYAEKFDTIHNYIDDQDILRKGAVAADEGRPLVIPMNMRDGVLICEGKGNANWNWSAPHGAGRILSRSEAKRTLTMEEYEAEMDGIYTTSVNESTLDESPMAYKPMEEILAQIGDTVDIIDIAEPLYNFKAGDE